MNSWHTWSPNSRWLAFASKGNSPYTEIFITHIDESGESSPALRLFRFSHPELAAMVPEFVPTENIYPRTIELADPEGATGESMATDGR
jgi:Tol biopolymer transport system component